MGRALSRFVVIAIAMTLALLGSSSDLAGADIAPSDGGDTPLVCHTEGSIFVPYDPEHPYLVGVIEVDENCQQTVRYEDLSAEEFCALAGDAAAEAGEKVAAASPRTPTGSPDFVLRSRSTQKIKGVHDARHFGEKMVEVSSQMRWWYNGVSVTDYGEGLCRRWNGNCWNPSGSLGCWWDTHNMPYQIEIVAQSSFTVAWPCWPACPGCGGWLRVETSGTGSGAHGTYCQHDFSGPWPTIYYCYHVHV
jgi:hypothetical protein